MNHVFKLQRFTVKFIPPQYRIGDFPFDIQLTGFSNVIAVADEEGSVIPLITFSYISVSDIADNPVGSVISKIILIFINEVIF